MVMEMRYFSEMRSEFIKNGWDAWNRCISSSRVVFNWEYKLQKRNTVFLDLIHLLSKGESYILWSVCLLRSTAREKTSVLPVVKSRQTSISWVMMTVSHEKFKIWPQKKVCKSLSLTLIKYNVKILKTWSKSRIISRMLQ